MQILDSFFKAWQLDWLEDKHMGVCVLMFRCSLYDLETGNDIYNTSRTETSLKPRYIFLFISIFWACVCGPLARRGGKKMVINDVWSELLIFALQFCGLKPLIFTVVGVICEDSEYFLYILSSNIMALRKMEARLYVYFICSEISGVGVPLQHRNWAVFPITLVSYGKREFQSYISK